MLNGPKSRVLAEGLRAAMLLLCLVAVPLAAAYVVGTQLPEEHTATASGIVQATPTRVWELITDFTVQQSWRKGPLILVRGPVRQANGEPCWLEGWLLAKLTLCEVDSQPDRKRVVRTLGASLPFGSTWTYDLSPNDPDGSTTRLAMTQQSSLESPLERFIGRYVLRQNTSTEQYLRDLQAEALRHP